jgi:hypothetical protein
MMAFSFSVIRHAELVSASIFPAAQAPVAGWTLKKVQGDDCCEGREA